MFNKKYNELKKSLEKTQEQLDVLEIKYKDIWSNYNQLIINNEERLWKLENPSKFKKGDMVTIFMKFYWDSPPKEIEGTVLSVEFIKQSDITGRYNHWEYTCIDNDLNIYKTNKVEAREGIKNV